MLLGKVLKNINTKYKSIKFKNIRFNSKECKPNDIFFAISGNEVNGNNYIKNAINNGAKIIVSDLKFEGFDNNKVLFVRSKNTRNSLAEAASKIYYQKSHLIYHYFIFYYFIYYFYYYHYIIIIFFPA